MAKKKKNKRLEVIDVVSYNDKKAKDLLEAMQEEIKSFPVKGIISIIVPSKGRPLLYTNMAPEDAFLHTYRATSLVANMISLNEEGEENDQESE